METKWYAVYTKSRWEKKVVEQLNKLSIENYCPLNRIVRQWSDRKKVVQEPLFTSYVFVKITDRQISELRAVFGVVNLVYWLGKPAVILDSEIEIIRQFLANHYNVKLERAPLHVHDKVKILTGPFMEMEGSVLSVKKHTLKVLLPSLRFFMTAEIEIENVSKIMHDTKYGKEEMMRSFDQN
jgi:transcription antitermination factor NusG